MCRGQFGRHAPSNAVQRLVDRRSPKGLVPLDAQAEGRDIGSRQNPRPRQQCICPPIRIRHRRRLIDQSRSHCFDAGQFDPDDFQTGPGSTPRTTRRAKQDCTGSVDWPPSPSALADSRRGRVAVAASRFPLCPSHCPDTPWIVRAALSTGWQTTARHISEQRLTV